MNDELQNALVEYYKYRNVSYIPSRETIVMLQSFRKNIIQYMLVYTNNTNFENVHDMLSPIALMMIMQREWIIEQGIDNKFIVENNTYYKWDHKFPVDILEIFKNAWLELFPNFQIKQCRCRQNYDFKDVVYHYEDMK